MSSAFCFFLPARGLAEDLIFFADDHYKSLGRPELTAGVANPVLVPGDSILRINLANAGELEELIPINESGPYEDILQEMIAETKSCDALNINAVLGGARAIKVTTGSAKHQCPSRGCRGNAIVSYHHTEECKWLVCSSPER